MRVLFWSLIIAGLAAFFGLMASHPTVDDQILLFGSVGCMVVVIFASAAFGMLVYGFKKRSIVAAGKYGGMEFQRDSQPFGYWAVMLMYFTFFLLFSYAAYRTALTLVPPLLKHLNY